MEDNNEPTQQQKTIAAIVAAVIVAAVFIGSFAAHDWDLSSFFRVFED